MSNHEIADRVRGALYGVAIGDALGAPLEFMDANSIKREHGLVTEMIGGGWLNVKPGEITDDTQMTIAVAKGIIENPDDPVPAVGRHFIDWIRSGPKDVGGTCSNAIRHAMEMGAGRGGNIPKDIWMEASKKTAINLEGRTAGNGALMRTIYPALYYQPGMKMLSATADIAMMTHRSPVSTKCCIQYVQEVCLMINGYDGPVGLYSNKRHRPSGYVIDSYVKATEALGAGLNFIEALVFAVNQGGDADTIGAITGGLAGAKYGYSRIPKNWIHALDPGVREQLDELIAAIPWLNR